MKTLSPHPPPQPPSGADFLHVVVLLLGVSYSDFILAENIFSFQEGTSATAGVGSVQNVGMGVDEIDEQDDDGVGDDVPA
jgi:hypothetical protein